MRNLYDYDHWNYYDGFSEYGELKNYEHRSVGIEKMELRDNIYTYREIFDLYGIYEDEYMNMSGKLDYGVVGEKKLKTYYKYGFVDKEGEIVSEAVFDIVSGYKEGLAAVAKRIKVDSEYLYKWGFINTQGSKIVPHIFDEVHDFKNGYARVRIKEKWSFINKFGDLITDLIFEDNEDFYCIDDILSAEVRIDDKWGIINKNGHYLIYPQYYYIETCYDTKFTIAIFDNGKYNLYNRFLPVTLLQDYTYIHRYSDKLFLVKNSNKYGLIDQQGKIVIECIYDCIQDLGEDQNAVKQGELWGIIDNKGKIIIECKCDSVGKFKDSVACVRINKLWGLVDKGGSFHIEPKFENVWGKVFNDLKDKAIISLKQ